MFRDYSLSWDSNDPNGLPPPNVILDDYGMACAMTPALKGDERHARWPVNFMSKGYPDWHLRGTGRAAKIWRNGQWKYSILKGTELHGGEIRNPRAKRDVSKRSVKPEEHSKNRAAVQDDDLHTEDERYSRAMARLAVRYRDNRRHGGASSGTIGMSSAQVASSPAAVSSSDSRTSKKKKSSARKRQKRKHQTSSLKYRRRVCRKSAQPRPSPSPSGSPPPPLPLQPTYSSSP